MRKKSTLYLTRGALVAALYVALTYLATLFGLSSGVIQFRFSEALCVLPIFMPEAVLGLNVGCLLSNIISGCVIWDIIFGTLATLIGALGARLIRRLPNRLMWLSTLPTILANSLIVPFVLLYAYGASGGYFYFMLTVFIGEAVCAGIFGSILYYTLNNSDFSLF